MLSSPHPVRFSVLLLGLVAIAGCPVANEKSLGADNGDDGVGGGGGAPPHVCSRDTDCVLAAATCCDCPTFAVNEFDPALRACMGVMCPGTNECPANVDARCTDGDCVLACTALTCAQSFAAGYRIDPATGCLSCEEATPDSGCSRDTDCVETRADCCGCHAGGADTAVLASQRASYDAELGCPSFPSCPAVNVCEAGAAPHCVQGRCELFSTTGIQAPLCGRTDLPACGAGLVCTINLDPQASLLGVGVCVSP